MTAAAARSARRAAAIAVAACAWGAGAPSVVAQERPPAAPVARPAVVPDQEPGARFEVRADALPAPYATPATSSPAQVLTYDGQTPIALPGFTVSLVARLEHPRRLLVLPDGDVVVAEQNPGHITRLAVPAPGARAEPARLADAFELPYGLAWRDGEILVADQRGIWAIPYALRADGKPGAAGAKRLVGRHGVFGPAGGHVNRPLAIDPRDGSLYVGVGSIGNIGVEPAVKATIQQFAADGSGQRTVVSGTRNPTGLAVDPATGAIWAVVQERDGLGDRLVPDFLVRVRDGAFFGWPYAYTGRNPQRGFAEKAPDKVAASEVPDLLFEAHSSTLDIVFARATAFPESWRDGAFVALRGSWNRGEPTGYKIVHVPFANGKPVGHYRNFLTGFWVRGTRRAEVWGRPAALAVTTDGALLVADDTAGTVWRIAADRATAR